MDSLRSRVDEQIRTSRSLVEEHHLAMKIVDVEPILGDVNGDGVVDVTDLLLMISDWGSCADCPSDVNNDGYVNVTDILIAIGNWG